MSKSLAVNEAAKAPALSSRSAHDERLIDQAIALLEQRLFQRGPLLDSPSEVRKFLKLKLSGESNEVFAAIFLDGRHRVIAFEILFRGTIDSAEVHPRVVLMRSIERNAAAVVFAHNHPSGHTEPSAADRHLTTRLREVLALVDIRVLDHIIVGAGEPYSFAEAGLL